MSDRQPADIGQVFSDLAAIRKANKALKPPPGHVPKWYGYGRVSDRKQLGDSPEAQEQRIRAYWAMKVSQDPSLANVEPGGVRLEPRAKSAWKTAFSGRPAGRELVGLLMPGDHLIVDKMDRMFRDQLDFAVMLDYLRGRNVALHIANWMGASVEMNTPMGDWIMQSMANNAAFESAQTADRVKKARARRREQGLWTGLGKPWLCTIIGTNDKNTGINDRRLIWSPHLRVKMQEVVKYRDQYRLSSSRIAMNLEKKRIMSGGEALKHPFWTPRRVVEAYWTHKAIEAAVAAGQEEPDPNKIDFSKFWREYQVKWKAEHGSVGRRPYTDAYDLPEPCPEPPPEDPDGIVFYTKAQMKDSEF